MDDIYVPAGVPRDPLVTDERPQPEIPAFADDVRPVQVLENVTGVKRRKGYWRRALIDPVTQAIERVLFAARSIS